MSYTRIAFSALAAAGLSAAQLLAAPPSLGSTPPAAGEARNVFVLDRDAAAADESAKPKKKKGSNLVSRLFRNASQKAEEAENSADLLVALARMRESGGDVEAARNLLIEAVKADPDSLDALLAYGRLLDRNGELDQAIAVYQTAASKHPDNARVWNDLGLGLARTGQFAASREQLVRAVQLSPDEPRYRNNLATVLIELGATGEAVAQLSSVHAPAVAHYNAGFLLQKSGRTGEALAEFQKAAELDPALAEAQQWIAHLAPTAQQQQSATQYAGVVPYAASQATRPSPAASAAPQRAAGAAAQAPYSGPSAAPTLSPAQQFSVNQHYQVQQQMAARSAAQTAAPPTGQPNWAVPAAQTPAPQQAPLPGALPNYLGRGQQAPQPQMTAPAAAPLPPNTAQVVTPMYTQGTPQVIPPGYQAYYAPQPANPYQQVPYQAAAPAPEEKKENWFRAALPKGKWRL